MKLKVSQLRQIIAEEVQDLVGQNGRLVEGSARITAEEFAAWKSGDWGFVSEAEGVVASGMSDVGGSGVAGRIIGAINSLEAAQAELVKMSGVSTRGHGPAAVIGDVLRQLDDVLNQVQ